MKTPLYLAFCGFAIVAGCVVGSAWFGIIMFMESKDWHVFELLPLFLFDAFLFGWVPALLFGAFLHFVMFRFGWMKFWQWTLVGACMAWTLFVAGGWIAKSDVLSIVGLGLGLLRNLSRPSWPAAICGAIVALVLRPLAIRWANPIAAIRMAS